MTPPSAPAKAAPTMPMRDSAPAFSSVRPYPTNAPAPITSTTASDAPAAEPSR